MASEISVEEVGVVEDEEEAEVDEVVGVVVVGEVARAEGMAGIGMATMAERGITDLNLACLRRSRRIRLDCKIKSGVFGDL